MVKFGFENYQKEFSDWSKHHKMVSVLVKRIYEDGKEILASDEQLRILTKNNEDKLKSKKSLYYNSKSNQFRRATDYFLPLNNLDYQEANVDYYSVGAMNTRQTTRIRLTFLAEYDKFILDYSYESEGSFATNFFDMCTGNWDIENIIDEVIEQNKTLEEVGISKGEESELKVIFVTPEGDLIEGEIDKDELLKSLISIEVYSFEYEIVD